MRAPPRSAGSDATTSSFTATSARTGEVKSIAL
jgi:hypothetical protein